MVARARILVVDDEELIAQLLTGVLRGEGHDAEYVTDGEAALSKLRGRPFDLLVTDLRMPRMDGIRLIEEAKAICPGTDALIMTAFASAETAVDALRQGVSDCLSKPFGVDDIRAAVGKCLDAREQRRTRAEEVETLAASVAEARGDLGRRVADLSFLHDLTRLIADRGTPLSPCLKLIAHHFGADLVLLVGEGGVVARHGEGGDRELLDLARASHRAGLPREGRGGLLAASLSTGAVALRSPSRTGREDLRLLSIAARDLALAVENDRLRALQRRSYIGIVATLIEAVEAKDRFNRGHSRRVADLAVRFGQGLGLAERECELLEVAAKLHDIGKIGIPEEILNKPGRLTEQEFDIIKAHPVIGEQILVPLDFLAETRPIVRHHHERWDGEGYPDRLKADAIPRHAAILAIVDSFDAMTSKRPYRDGLPAGRALEILREGAGTQWDPALVHRFETVPP